VIAGDQPAAALLLHRLQQIPQVPVHCAFRSPV
jgi:hypothetical protein